MRKIKLLHEKLNLHHLKIENLIFFFRLEKRIFSWMSFMHLQWRSPIVVRSTKMPMLRLIVGWTPTQGQLRFSGTKRATRDSYKMGRPSGSKGSRPFTMDVIFAQHPTFFSQLVRDRFELKFHMWQNDFSDRSAHDFLLFCKIIFIISLLLWKFSQWKINMKCSKWINSFINLF